MPRKNIATHGRRLKPHPVMDVPETAAINFEALARGLVRRGLATKVILDGYDNLHTPTERTFR
jgi:hypothetical protein